MKAIRKRQLWKLKVAKRMAKSAIEEEAAENVIYIKSKGSESTGLKNISLNIKEDSKTLERTVKLNTVVLNIKY